LALVSSGVVKVEKKPPAPIVPVRIPGSVGGGAANVLERWSCNALTDKPIDAVAAATKTTISHTRLMIYADTRRAERKRRLIIDRIRSKFCVAAAANGVNS
jgi:hypothetical protein